MERLSFWIEGLLLLAVLVTDDVETTLDAS